MCLNYDPFKYADIYESEWDLYLHEYIKTIEEVEEIYQEGLITKEEYEYGLEVIKQREG